MANLKLNGNITTFEVMVSQMFKVFRTEAFLGKFRCLKMLSCMTYELICRTDRDISLVKQCSTYA